jgi:hypothetical protein
MQSNSISSFLNEKTAFIGQYLPPKKHVLTALKVALLLAALCLIAKVGIPFIIQGNALRSSVPHPLWNSVTVAQKEIWEQGLRLTLIGYSAIASGIASIGWLGKSLHLDF